MQIFFLNFTGRHLIKFRNTALKCSKTLQATQDFNQSSKTHIINKPITFEHIQVPRAKEIDQLSRNVIGFEDSECQWCLSMCPLSVYCFVWQPRGSIGAW